MSLGSYHCSCCSRPCDQQEERLVLLLNTCSAWIAYTASAMCCCSKAQILSG